MNLDPSRFFVAKRHMRVSSPSGGVRASSDIFNTSDQPSPARKVRDNQKSSIVNTGVGIDTNGNLKRNASSPRHQDNTKNRLFGANGDTNGLDASPRRNNDTWRSNIMFANGIEGQTMPDGLKRTPKKRIPTEGVNPITGTPQHGFTPTHTNGMTNGTNGYDHDDVLTVMYGGAEGNGPIAVLNGHGDYNSSPRRRAAQIANSP